MTVSLQALDGRRYDVLVIGGGINGAAAAQHLSAAGYDVLLVEQGDWGSGSTSRSSRMQGCGLNYFFAFAPGGQLWRYALHPERAFSALGLARDAMRMRAEMLRTAPGRLRTFAWSYPIYRGGKYSGPQIKAGLRLLDALAPADGKLGRRSLSANQARTAPLLRFQRDPEDLLGAAQVTYVQYDWPERINVDVVLDAERMGATARNYTRVGTLRHAAGGWTASLEDTLGGGAATVSAAALVNMAGIWIDGVNQLGEPAVRRLVNGNKGVHIAFQLPPECADQAVVNFSTGAEPFFCAPFGKLHYVGPTEENHTGKPGDLAVTEADVEHLVHEVQGALPGIGLRRKDVVFAWAGVRPLTYAGPDFPDGRRGRVLHDLARLGMPDAWALTGGSVMTHRISAADVVRAVGARVGPSRAAQAMSYAPPPGPGGETGLPAAQLRHGVQHEHARTLADLMFRRVGLGWNATMGADQAEAAAAAVADLWGWDGARVRAEAAAYREYLAQTFLCRPAVSPAA